MKSEEQIRAQLDRTFRKRLALRIERKMKPICRNCMNKEDVPSDMDGIHFIRYHCKKGNPFKKEGECRDFKCLYNESSIREEMVRDIQDPATRGAKEPTISALVWVLNDGEEPAHSSSFLGWLKKFIR